MMLKDLLLKRNFCKLLWTTLFSFYENLLLLLLVNRRNNFEFHKRFQLCRIVVTGVRGHTVTQISENDNPMVRYRKSTANRCPRLTLYGPAWSGCFIIDRGFEFCYTIRNEYLKNDNVMAFFRRKKSEIVGIIFCYLYKSITQKSMQIAKVVW